MEKRQFRILYRQFLFRMVDLELLSSHAQGDIGKLLGQFAALLIFTSVILAWAALMSGPAPASGPPLLQWVQTWTVEHFLIATTMLAVGLFAVLSWDSTFPNRRDVLVLASLPVRARTLFLAKIAATGVALGLTVAALHLLAGLAWPLVLNRPSKAQPLPALTADPAIAPVDMAHLKPVLDRDFAPSLGRGPLGPGGDSGIAIGVVQHGIRRVFTYGTARPDSLFEIGSVTKTFTGLALARMAAEGKVRLDEPVRELLPPGTVARPRGREITLLDLATQHSGLPRMPEDFHPRNPDNPFADYHASDLYSYLARHGVAKPPDAEFLYSNLGFGLLGQALANRAGMPWADLVREEITGPLRMIDTVVALSADQQQRFLPGHNAEHGRVPAIDLDAFAGAGALRSTVGDMLTLLEADLHPEREPGTLESALVDSHRLRADAGGEGRIALAWFYDPRHEIYIHDGATPGYTAMAFFSPARDYAGIALANTGPASGVSADIVGSHLLARLTGEPAISIAEITIPAGGGLGGFLRMFAAYWFTMAAGGLFIFGLVLAIQGLAAQLPRRIFLRLSSFLQLGCFCLFVSVYFLEPPTAFAIADERGIHLWLPTYWFLGLFQQLNGSPALSVFAWRAWIGLAAVLIGTAVAYGLSCIRTLRKIVEEPDIVPGHGGAGRLPRFGNALETAVTQFSIRTLVRSRRHRMILAFYAGLGFALTILFLKTPRAAELSAAAAAADDSWRQASVPLLASSIVMMIAWVLGMRVVFAMPLDLPANWIFRAAPVPGGRALVRARRRAAYVLSVAPAWVLFAAVLFALWPWREAASHLAILGLLGLVFAEFLLGGIQKIPFTCSYLPGKSYVVFFWMSVAAAIALIGEGAKLELDALHDPATWWAIVGTLAVAWIVLCWRTYRLAASEAAEYEEAPADRILSLDLYWDAKTPGAREHYLRPPVFAIPPGVTQSIIPSASEHIEMVRVPGHRSGTREQLLVPASIRAGKKSVPSPILSLAVVRFAGTRQNRMLPCGVGLTCSASGTVVTLSGPMRLHADVHRLRLEGPERGLARADAEGQRVEPAEPY